MSEENIESGKFICQYCNKQFSRKCNLTVHSKTCYKNPNRVSLHHRKDGGWICAVCGEKFLTRAEHNEHKAISHTDCRCSQTHPKKIYKCSFCNKEWETTIEGFHTHEKYCIENPNRVMPKSHPVSDELRKRISEKQKENYKGRSIFNIDRSHEPFSEKYFREWLEKEHIDYKKNFHVNRFFLDFAFPDKKIYFEVNGEQHYRKMYSGRDYQERDKEREYIISQSGWKCIATIRWSEFRALSLDERSAYLENLKLLII